MAKLFLAFTVTTAVEMYLLITIGGLIGPLGTVLLILITGALGAWLAQREGFAVLANLGEHMKNGEVGQGIAEGALVLAGSMLLLTPGLLTDITGFLFIVPFTRRRIAPHVVDWFGRTFEFKAFTGEELRGGFGSTGRPVDMSAEARAQRAARAQQTEKDPKSLPFDHPV